MPKTMQVAVVKPGSAPMRSAPTPGPPPRPSHGHFNLSLGPGCTQYKPLKHTGFFVLAWFGLVWFSLVFSSILPFSHVPQSLSLGLFVQMAPWSSHAFPAGKSAGSWSQSDNLYGLNCKKLK